MKGSSHETQGKAVSFGSKLSVEYFKTKESSSSAHMDFRSK